jgi:branched-chain amino acid transport system ATP-binding protein
MLTLEGLSARYGRIAALDSVSLTVGAAEFVSRVGATGAGETATLQTVSGLVRAAAGRILFDGQEIQHLAPQDILRRGIAHCPEGRRVFPHMTVEENLQMGAYVRTDTAAVTADRDRVFGHFPILAERRRQPAGTLSGGEQQMLAIGRALMSKPRVLLLDEPSLGLAPLVVQEIMRLLAALRAAGTTILLVEQNARLALRFADRAYVLEVGRVALSGASADLLADDQLKAAYLGG